MPSAKGGDGGNAYQRRSGVGKERVSGTYAPSEGSVGGYARGAAPSVAGSYAASAYGGNGNNTMMTPQQQQQMMMAGGYLAAPGNNLPILASGDLMTLTKKQIRDDLSRRFAVDLKPRKDAINRMIDDVLQGRL
eukprot:jgi/Hompol1/3507/HPOL_006622-RA